MGKAIEHDPFFEIHVLVLHLLNHIGEESFHLFLERVKLGELGVGVVANYILQLSPGHLLTVLVEQTAAVLVGSPCLADEPWLAAVGVDADELALVAVNTLWGVSN